MVRNQKMPGIRKNTNYPLYPVLYYGFNKETMHDYKEDLSPMVEILRKLHDEGYHVQFKADETGIISNASEKHYKPGKVHIRHFYRFEGESSSDDSSIVYAIETNSGEKGTLIDSYGAYSDPHIAKFIREVESISK